MAAPLQSVGFHHRFETPSAASCSGNQVITNKFQHLAIFLHTHS